MWDPAGLPAAAEWLWSLNYMYITNSTTAPGGTIHTTAHETRGLQQGRIKPSCLCSQGACSPAGQRIKFVQMAQCNSTAPAQPAP